MWYRYKTRILNSLLISFAVSLISVSAFCWSRVLQTPQGNNIDITEVAEVTTQSRKKEDRKVMVLIGIFVVFSQYLTSE